MTHYPYDRLVDVREPRLTRAMDEVRRRKEARRSARSAADACRATLDALLAEREHSQHQLLRNDAGRLNTASLARLDLHLDLLATRAGEAAKSLSEANDRLCDAESELTEAQSRYHKLHAKRDALIQHRRQWTKAHRRGVARGEEAAVEDSLQAEPGVLRSAGLPR